MTEKAVTFDKKIISSGDCGPAVSWQLTDDGLLTVSGTGAIKCLPDEGAMRTEQYPWFPHREAVTSLSVLQGVTEIGDGAFKYFDHLESAEISDSVIRIGERAFYCCPKLKNVTIPPGVTGIEKKTFFKCECLEGIDLPDGVKTIREKSFFGCRALKEIRFPQELVSIGSSAFSGCILLQEITLPSSIRHIGYEAFADCKELKNAEIPAALVISEDKDIFLGCDRLEVRTLFSPPDEVQRAMFELNDELSLFSDDYLCAANSVYAFWFEEITEPKNPEIKGRIENADVYISRCVEELIFREAQVSSRYTDAVPEEMTNRIMRVLDAYEPEVFELSSQGFELYGQEVSWMDTLHCLVRLRGERTHWYAVWSMWSD